MRRQFLATWANESVGAPEESAAVAQTAEPVSEVRRATLKRSFDARKQQQERYAVQEGAPEYFITTRLIERIVIENIRLIHEPDLACTPPATTGAPWLMLLGENGTGKSTILQSVALTLIGDGYRRRLGVNPQNYLRRGTRRGRIEVYLSNTTEPLTLEITREGFRSSSTDPKVLLLGYGATRLLPRPEVLHTSADSDAARVDNLFDPFTPLGDATRWLLDLPPARFTTAARALRGTLDLDPAASLRRNRRSGRIEVDSYGERVPIEYVSDGYQSVLGLAVDV